MFSGQQFTFWGSSIPENDCMSLSKYLFQIAVKLRPLDIFWNYFRARSETNSTCAGARIYISDDFSDCLFNGLIAYDFPWKLLSLAIDTKDLLLFDYLTSEVAAEHMSVMAKLVPGLADVQSQLTGGEGATRHQFDYREQEPLTLYRPYHEAFEKVASVRQRQLEAEKTFAAEREILSRRLADLQRSETELNLKWDTASGEDDVPAISRICADLEQVTNQINDIESSLEELAEGYAREAASLKELEADFFLV
jgi:hypothetical protein